MDNYRFEVLQLFERKKASGELSINLTYPTPAKLREECYLLFTSKRYNKADISILKSFFECPLEEEIRASRIKRFDIDKFRPLRNFLKLGINTQEKNVELLAWLIDFKLRPYSRYVDTVGLSGLQVSKAGDIVGRNFLEIETRITEFPESIKEIETYTQESVAVRTSKQIVLEYPSGVKLRVEANDLNLIAQLVKL